MVYIGKNWRPRRSVLYMPGSNRRALTKAPLLDCDGVIFDLEDSVSREDQGQARENLIELVRGRDFGGKETIIRVSALGSSDYPEDVATAIGCSPDAILLSMVESRQMLEDLSGRLQSSGAKNIGIWAMIESPLALVNLKEISSFGGNLAGKLECLVVGPNDLAKETGVAMKKGREAMLPWLMDIVAHGRAYGLGLLDGVFNAFRDEEGFNEECGQGALMGFDGKTLIHPAQIDAANQAFSPDETDIAHASAVVELFSRQENQGKNALQLDGEMVERLHLESAQKLLDLLDRLRS
jgi:citrate lyase subunit beta/citryl-CoA lyase